jgi:hypothetical protein
MFPPSLIQGVPLHGDFGAKTKPRFAAILMASSDRTVVGALDAKQPE